jgi:hypothetical protein
MIQLKWIVWPLLVLLLAWIVYEMWPEQPAGTVKNSNDGFAQKIIRSQNLVVQFWHNDELFATYDRYIYRSRDKGLNWEKVAKLLPGEPGLFASIADKMGGLKLVRNLRSFLQIDQGPNLLVLEDGTLLLSPFQAPKSYLKQALRPTPGIYKGSVTKGKITRLHNMLPGIGMLHQGWTQDDKGMLFTGQYQTGDHESTRLYWSQDSGKTWTVRNEFPRTKIRHIHAVAFDPYRKLLWVSTGDRDHESRILYSSDQGKTFQELGSGSQDWRAVSLQFTPDAVYWGSEGHQNLNHIFRWNWDKGEREKLLTVRNAFMYSTQDSQGNLYFATNIRPKITEGTMFAEIWMISPNRSPQRILILPKYERVWSHRRGSIKFAQGIAPKGWLAFSLLNLEGHLCETMVIELAE